MARIRRLEIFRFLYQMKQVGGSMIKMPKSPQFKETDTNLPKYSSSKAQ